MINEIIEGDEWARYVVLERPLMTEHGNTYPARAVW